MFVSVGIQFGSVNNSDCYLIFLSVSHIFHVFGCGTVINEATTLEAT
jgi:hypothetical protein